MICSTRAMPVELQTAICSKHRGMPTDGVVLYHDNTQPHMAAVPVETIRKLKFELLPYHAQSRSRLHLVAIFSDSSKMRYVDAGAHVTWRATEDRLRRWQRKARGLKMTVYLLLCILCRIKTVTNCPYVSNSPRVCLAHIRGCIKKFPDWPLGARTANGTALCHWVQLYRCFLYCFSTSVILLPTQYGNFLYTRAVCRVHRLTAVRRFCAEGGGDCYAKLWWW
jgi:hypothetical protein